MGLLDNRANPNREKQNKAMDDAIAWLMGEAKQTASNIGQSAKGLLAPTTGTVTEGLTRALPITGEAWTANDAGNEANQGNYGQAALMAGLGLLPLGGLMAAGIRNGAKSVPKRMGQSGAIAYHGSPHKFDKFSLDKIGTGEGAQAYGHGLYLAEHPEVAMTYMNAKGEFTDTVAAKRYAEAKGYDRSSVLNALHQAGESRMSKLLGKVPQIESSTHLYSKQQIDLFNEIKSAIANGDDLLKPSLYKTDIPDEAVARFLDWDKPLSQQAPNVIKSLSALKKTNPPGYQKLVDAQLGGPLMDQATGRDLYQSLGHDAFNVTGIPGIRYLDGGSRSGGAGTSNFVAFDPELIRILERNGQPTGLQPWAKGEWKGLLGGAK